MLCEKEVKILRLVTWEQVNFGRYGVGGIFIYTYTYIYTFVT